MIIAVEMPPSCWFCLYLRYGVLQACAQLWSYNHHDSGSHGIRLFSRVLASVRWNGQAPLSLSDQRVVEHGLLFQFFHHDSGSQGIRLFSRVFASVRWNGQAPLSLRKMISVLSSTSCSFSLATTAPTLRSTLSIIAA